MTMEFGHNGCDAPCTTCSEARCQVCADISGDVAFLLEFDDIATNSTPDPSTTCDTCDTLNVSHELLLQDEVTSVSIVASVDAVCPLTDPLDLNDSSTYCIWAKTIRCGRPTIFVYEIFMAVVVYRTSGGDLRATVFVSTSYTGSAGCVATVNSSDDFLLATGATQFDCLDLLRASTLTTCSGTDPMCGCSVPVNYGLAVGAL